MSGLSKPLTPPDCDISDFQFMPLDVGRLRRSDLIGEAEPDAIVAALLLWGAAWHSKPAASLTNNDRSLAQAAGYGRAVDAFLKVKEQALRGFIECDDGRLYHPVVAEKARSAWDGKLNRLWRREMAAIRKHNERHPEDEKATVSFEQWKRERDAARNVTYDTPPMSQGQEDNVTRDTGGKSHATATRDGTPQPDLLDAPSLDQSQKPIKTQGNQSNSSMSHTTNANVTRDNGLDSCARAGKGEGEGEGEGEGDSNRLRSTTSTGDDDEFPILNEGESAKDETVSLIRKLARKAGIPIKPQDKLDKAIEVFAEWQEEGFDLGTIVAPTIERVAGENPSSPIYSFRYFDAHVRRAGASAERSKPRELNAMDPRPPIPIEDEDDEKVIGFRKRLAYHAGKWWYARHLAPSRMALKREGSVIVCLFASEVDRDIVNRSEDISHINGIASAMGLSARLRDYKRESQS